MHKPVAQDLLGRKRDAYRWFAGRVSRFASEGLGLQGEAWAQVEYASLEFMQAVDEWKGDKKGGLRVKRTGDALVAAWKEANENYLEEGGEDGEAE